MAKLLRLPLQQKCPSEQLAIHQPLSCAHAALASEEPSRTQGSPQASSRIAYRGVPAPIGGGEHSNRGLAEVDRPVVGNDDGSRAIDAVEAFRSVMKSALRLVAIRGLE